MPAKRYDKPAFFHTMPPYIHTVLEFFRNLFFFIATMHFDSLGLIDPILKALKEEGYATPTPIQAQSIPLILKGGDLLGCAQTGTGKTAAFSIPILQLLSERKPQGQTPGQPFQKKKPIRALIVTPTRELAIQIGESLTNYGRHTGLSSTVIFGGVPQGRQTRILQGGVDILVATPGRLLDLIDQKFVSLANIEIFVLDEADRMLDMGFIHDVKKLLKLIPTKRQSLFFSATMAPDIMKLADAILVNPAKVEVTPNSSTVEIIEQGVYFVDRGNKSALLKDILGDKDIKTVLVFTRTKHGADRLAKDLKQHGVSAEAIHGNKSQNARQRALAGFKEGAIRVLVATDIAARGIDIDRLEYVINYEIPDVAETYVHRIGRTGRAGACGTALTFCDALDKINLRGVEKLIGKKVPVIEGHPFPLMDHNPEIAPKGSHGRGPRPPRNQAAPGGKPHASAGRGGFRRRGR